MRVSTIIAILFVGGYIAFELTAIHRNQYRLEPVFIFQEFVTADQAVQRCGDPDVSERENFLNNLAAVRANALADISMRSLEDDDASNSNELAALRDAKIIEVNEFIDVNGCDDQTVWRWVKLHEVRSRLRLR
ncbi:MAG: hypothetical protein AAGB19_18035 [Cyanobacteria bacterium P01_F01_bin.3]